VTGDGGFGRRRLKFRVPNQRTPERIEKQRWPAQERQQIALSLEGTWDADHLFELKQSYELYQIYQGMVEECDKENPVGQIFRLCANTVAKSNSPMGFYFRRIKSRAGHMSAIVATAHKMAEIFFIMVRDRVAYDEGRVGLGVLQLFVLAEVEINRKAVELRKHGSLKEK